LYNQSFWEINNLEITNLGATRDTRRAVWVEAHDIGIASHIYLKGLYIHDVNGLLGRDDLETSGGIFIRATGGVTPTKFDDVLIEGNTFKTVDSSAVFTRNDWRNRGTRTDGTGPWLGFTKVVVRNNTLTDIGSDGIVICEAASPLIEYNVAGDTNKRATGPHVAIWNINTDDALFQYNEAYLTRNLSLADGAGFDADGLSNRTVFQYNYSHDNEGGFMLICDYSGADAFNDDGIIRYNISQNDRWHLFKLCGRNRNFNVYNNTFYVGGGLDVAFVLDHGDTTTSDSHINFYNNIIYNLDFNMTYNFPITPATFDYNTFFGVHDATEPNDPHKSTADPKLVNPGSGGNGITSVDGYKLLASSPAINSGKTIAGNGGKDYWGNPVPYAGGSTDRGAFEYQGAPSPAPVIGERWQASRQFSGVQGQDNWYYKRWNGSSYVDLTWDSANRQWVGAQSYATITRSHQAPDNNDDTLREWVAPASGTITITGNVGKYDVSGGDGVKVSIKKNSTYLWGLQTIAYNNSVGYTPYLTTTVVAGDKIMFSVNKIANDTGDTIKWDPIITWGDRKEWKASTGWSETQGNDFWYYKTWNGSSYTNMTWDSSRDLWVGSATYSTMTSTTQAPQTGHDAFRVWVAPKAGTVTIKGTVRKDVVTGGDGVQASIWKNGTALWGNQVVGYDDSTGYAHNVTTTVAVGDTISFNIYKLSDDSYDATNWDPVITYQ
jgi:hypothetical protein